MDVERIRSKHVNALPIICIGDDVTLAVHIHGTNAAFSPNTNYLYVTGTDANGCQNTDQVTVIVNALPTVSGDQTVCFGDNVTLSGSGASTYTWDNGITDNTAFTASTTTTYTVTGTDGNGCQNTDQVTVTVNALPTVSAGSDQTVCFGDDVTLSGSGASTYSWDNGITDNTAFTASTTTTYTVTGTDANGCQNTDQVTVTVNNIENASFAYSSSGFCSDGTDPVAVIVGVSGGTFSSTSGLVINSSTGSIDLDASTLGTYTITYTTPGTCTGSFTYEITISDPSADFNYGGTTEFCTGGSDPSATITGTTGGTFTSTPSGLSINANTGTIDVSASTAATYDVTYTPPAILQLGSDVDGVANADQFGWSVSMSNDGNRMVIGANLDDTPGTTAGSVEVYEYSSGSWTKMGSTINGEAASDQFGYAVSMNGAGTRIVVGAITNDGNGSNSGHVRVFDWNGTAWTQVGADINGESDTDYFGNSVSINDAGDRIVVGAYLNDGNGSNSGHARVFDWNGIVWTQVGADINGEAANDQFGYAVSMNGAGTRIVVGGFLNDGNGPNSGHARVFDWNGTAWTQLGADINGEAAYDQFGGSVSMNDAGTRIVVGARYNDGNGPNSGHARVFDWNGTAWTQLGADVNGEAAYDQFGGSVSMNDAGTRIVVGARYNDGGGSNSGHARVYDLVGTTWTQVDDDIDGGEANDYLGYSVGISASGHRIAVGAYAGDNNSNVNTGDVKVFSVNTICTTPLSITISETEDGTFTYASTEYCKSGSNPTPTVTGTSGGTFSSTAGLSINGSTGEINIAASTAGTYTVSYLTSSNLCAVTGTFDVTITDDEDGTFAYASAEYCVSGSDPTPTISGTSGGTFSSTAGLSINASTGEIDLSASTAGTYTVSYLTSSNTCAVTGTFDVTITDDEDGTFTYASTEYCKSGSNPTPTVTGTTGGTFSSTAGLSINGSTGEINIAASTAGTYTVSYLTSSNLCAVTGTFDVTITDDEDGTFTYASAEYCISGSDPTPTISGVTGGTFSSTAGLSINTSTGEIDLSASTAGTYTVSYLTSSNLCAVTGTFDVTITADEDGTFSYASTQPSQTIYFEGFTGQSGKGWSGSSSNFSGVDWTMDVSAATLYSGDVFQIITSSATGSQELFVRDVDGPVYWYSPQQNIVEFQNVSLSIDLKRSGTMESNDYIKVSVSIDGGAYQNINDLGGTNGYLFDDFFPTTSIASVSGLSGSTIQIRIEVRNDDGAETHTADNISLTGTPTEYCITGSDPTPTITGTTGGTFSSTAGLSINTLTGEIDLSASTAGTYIVSYLTSSNLCATTGTFGLAISEDEDGTFTYASSVYCVSGSDPTPTITGTTGGTFSSTAGLSINASTGEIDLSASTAGTYTVSYLTSSNTCAVTGTFDVTITDDEDGTFTYASTEYCKSGSNPTPTITGTTGGTFSSTAGLSINSSTGEIDIAASTAGTYTVSYLTSSNLCAVTGTFDVTITDDEDGTFTYASAEYCISGSDPTPTVTGTTGGTFSSTAGLSINASTGEIDLSASTAGTYTVSYLTSSNTCAVTGTFDVTITTDEDGTFSYAGSSGTLQTIYSEDFTGQNQKGYSYNSSDFTGVDWTMDVSSAYLTASTDYFKVLSERLEAQDVDGPVFWYSPQQNILGFQNVSLSIDLSESGTLENTDYYKVSVSIDGGAYQNINDLGGTNGYKTDDFLSATASVSGLSGSTIQIRIEMKNNEPYEYHRADNILLTGNPIVFCKSGTNPTPTITGTTGGTFSSTTGLSINASTGEIDLSTSTAGTYTISYLTSSNLCAVTGTFAVTITNDEDGTFTYAAASYCQTGTDPTPTISGTTGGTFSSTAGLIINSSTGEIDLSASSVGTYTVSYLTSSNVCAVTGTFDVTITPDEDASISYSSYGYCTDDSDPTPTITGTTGGTFSSTAGLSLNASTGQIDLDASTPGSYDVTYTTSSNACAQTSTQSITISVPAVGFSYGGTTDFCTDGNDPSATITGATGGTFTSTPSGLTIDASTGTIDVSASTAATYDVTYTPPAIEQLGSDIDGVANADQFGWSVSMSNDGNRMVIGANLDDTPGSAAGSVEVYEYSSGSWTKMGSTINGEAAGDQFGYAVSMNGAGTRIVVGAIQNDGNGSNSGHARVFDWNGTAWTQVGADIDGEAAGDQSGYAVSIDDAGDRIVIGAYNNDGGGSNSGHVRVYDLVGTTWTQVGSDINGEAANDWFGTAVSINGAGDRIVVGANLNDGNGSNSGHVRVFDWNGTTWTQVGADIDGEAPDDRFGTAVSIDDAGDRIVIGAYNNDGGGSNSGHVRVYDLVGTTWTQVGADINGEAAGDQFGSAVSMNGAGDRIVVGAKFNDLNGAASSGHARVYDLVGTTWTQVDDDIDGEEASDFFGHSVAISASGHRIAVGATGGDNNSNVNTGDVKVYSVNTICTTPLSITITDSEDASFSYASYGYCTDDSDPTPTITGTTGGTFSSTAGLSLNASTGQIDLDASTPGSYDVTYTTSSNACAQTSTQSITIAVPAVGFSYGGTTAFCTDGSDPSATITGTAGGTFTATPSGLTIDASTGTIDVSASAAATYDVTYTPPAIEQLGSDIDGVANGDQFGYAVSMSNDGNRMVIGANYDDTPGSAAGSVEVYEYSSGSWTKMGSTINGEAANDWFGCAVSMNGAGTRIVVGATYNDGGGTNSGHVRVFDWNGTAWTQVGADIDGEAADDRFGWAVSIDDAGDRIVIGAYNNDGGGSNSGHVRVYDLVGTTWTQVGADINGEAANDEFGYAVSINGSGDRIIVGAYKNDGGGSNSGHARVFDLVGTTWTQVGADIDGEAASDYFGTAVSMNDAGTRIVVGAYLNDGNGSNSGHARVFDLVGTTWTQVGADIDGEAADDRFGTAVSMNGAGNRIVVGARLNDPNGSNSGHARVYDLVGTTWTQLDDDIDGEEASDFFGHSVGISASGHRIAVGATAGDNNSNLNTGDVKVYSVNTTCTTPLSITIIESEDASISYASYGYCTDDSDPTPTITGTTGGTFSSTAGLSLNASTGQIDLDASTPGSYDVTYTTSSNACAQTSTQSITIAVPAVGFSYGGTTDFCTDGNDPSANITGATGGTFTSTPSGLTIDASTGTIDVSASAAATYDVTYTPPAIEQLGSDIDGVANADQFGYAVSMSNDGNRMVIGANFDDTPGSAAGSVEVYEYSSGSWTKMGSTINGEAAGDYFGISVSMNGAGDRIVVGANLNDGNGSNSGHVRVFDWNGTAWTQVGADIDGEAADDRFGYAVSIDDAGDRIVIGAYNNDGGGSNSGHVRVYDLVGTTWTQVGADINGEVAGDQFGHAVSINNAGDRIVVGARLNDGGGTNSGHVRVYDLVGTAWTQVGADINGEAASDYSGSSVSINGSGDRIVVGATHNDGGGSNSGHIRVFDLVGTTWTQVGADIDGEAADDQFGFAVSTNDAGDRIIVGAIFNDPNGASSGHARVYDLVGTTWTQVDDDIDGEETNDYFGNSVGISASGHRIAVGAKGGDNNSNINTGDVKVYSVNTICTTPLSITIIESEDASFSYASIGYCTDDSDPTPTITGTTGGTFSSTAGISLNASTGQIDLDASTPGSYDVTYTTSSNACAQTSTQSITIAVPAVGFSYGGTSEFCTDGNDPSATITGTTGGIFTATPSGLTIDASTGTIDVSASAAATYDVTYTPPAIEQLGSDIDGVANADQFGWSVSMSNDGNRMVIGANFDDTPGTNAGSVEVYEYSSGSWTKMGSTINGEAAYDQFGYAVSMNGAGTRIVVGAIQNDGNGSNSGHARVFDWNGTTWTQVGADIDGEAADDRFGWSVSINGSGDRIVVGAINNDGGGSNSGHVRVYDLVGTTWTQVGADINGEAASDQFGYAVSINGAGDRIVVGARLNDGGGSNSGHVRVFDWNGTTWTQVGADINGEAADDYFGTAVSMNGAGNRIVVGATSNDGNGSNSGHVRVYDLIGTTWTQVGADIDGEAASDQFGNAVSVNDAGDRIIVGAKFNDPNGNSSGGHARVYDLVGTTWTQVGDDIDGEAANDYFGSSVGISASGHRIAVGATAGDNNSNVNTGDVKVFSLNTICTTPLSITISQPESANMSYDNTDYCTIGSDPTPTVTGTTGGTFSSTAGLSINTSTGAIDLSASTAGTYTVQYITSSNQCADTATFDLTVTVCADNDGDGIPDNIDDDDDNDGISDVDEGTGDSDGDGISDYLDLDSDNDGIYDVVEGGNGDQDTNGDGVIDSNDTGFTDTDNDGMADGTDGTTPSDTDGDNIPDYLDIDSDNDGIFDVVEGGDGASDTNNDGVVDSNDTGYADADGDGMSDNTESTTEPNTDGDNIPDYLDIDSDNDGIFDVVEGGDGASDTNGDGVIDSNDTGYADADGDGMSDNTEATTEPNNDGDNIPDYLDLDADNDGIYDVVEGGDGASDTNNDGMVDSNDTGYADTDGRWYVG